MKLSWLLGDPRQDAYDRVKHAQQVLARRIADAQYEREMIDFYTARVQSIDPYHSPERAQLFADSMRGQWDHQQDFMVQEMRVEEARAQLDARIAQLKQLENV